MEDSMRESIRERLHLEDRTLEELREMVADVPLDVYELEVVNDEIESLIDPTPEHEARPNPDAMPGGVFTTCAEDGCAVPVWREDNPGDGWDTLSGGTWRHVEDDEMDEERRLYEAQHGHADSSNPRQDGASA